MTAPLPSTVDERIEALLARLETALDTYAAAVRAAAAAEAEYRRTQAFVWTSTTSGTEKQRTMTVAWKCQTQHRAHLDAAAEVEVQKATMTVLRSSLDALRTLSAGQRGAT